MKFNELLTMLEMSVDNLDNFEILQDANAYKQVTKIQRIPIVKIIQFIAK